MKGIQGLCKFNQRAVAAAASSSVASSSLFASQVFSSCLGFGAALTLPQTKCVLQWSNSIPQNTLKLQCLIPTLLHMHLSFFIMTGYLGKAIRMVINSSWFARKEWQLSLKCFVASAWQLSNDFLRLLWTWDLLKSLITTSQPTEVTMGNLSSHLHEVLMRDDWFMA